MSIFTATAQPAGIGLLSEIDVNGRHTILTDEPESLGGTDAAPTPHELLPAMLASCVSTMILLYARRRDWALEGMRVDVSYDTGRTPRAIELTLHLPGDLSDEQVARLRRVADTCPVRGAFEAGFTFDERIEREVVAGPANEPAPSPRASVSRAAPRR